MHLDLFSNLFSFIIFFNLWLSNIFSKAQNSEDNQKKEREKRARKIEKKSYSVVKKGISRFKNPGPPKVTGNLKSYL